MHEEGFDAPPSRAVCASAFYSRDTLSQTTKNHRSVSPRRAPARQIPAKSSVLIGVVLDIRQGPLRILQTPSGHWTVDHPIPRSDLAHLMMDEGGSEGHRRFRSVSRARHGNCRHQADGQMLTITLLDGSTDDATRRPSALREPVRCRTTRSPGEPGSPSPAPSACGIRGSTRGILGGRVADASR